ncbi:MULTISPECIES: dihydrofolate reductase family protein [Streptosporangium]|uniref:Dihydrofolate reductase n=1 Tax=Streptosporangium brasiliense TaxID=47480 RepID=A0ABT9R2I6_9ACTN|nr:dihydrofolate reductase family protein [Streptosporangium brasiliense]MDP9863446.1 dihydrofolate reductase [Streptosporangium brasiliense]
MRKLVYYVALSIDGRIAGPGGEFDFYPLADDMAAWMNTDYPETVPGHVRAQIGLDAPNRRFDTLVMGRGTYQPALDADITSPYPHLKQYVVSTTIPEIADPAVELVPGDPVGLVRRLKREEGLDIWLCGGGKLAGALFPEIDELIVKNYPVVAGAGLPAFAGEFRPTLFTPTQSRSFSNGATVTWYGRA